MRTGRLGIATKAAIVAILSVLTTLIIATMASWLFGGEVAGTGLLLCILCPLVIAGPASAWQFRQHDRLRETREALLRTKTELETANSKLRQAYRSLEHRARHDGLTGVLNREAFIETATSRLCEYGGTLLLIDADNFKQINDRYGHPTGDKALRSIARAIAKQMSARDVHGRIGGEEFAVFLPEVDGSAAFAAAEAIRHSVRSTLVGDDAGASITVSVSIGGAESGPVSEIEALWRTADRHLYRAKRMGRDRVNFGDDRTDDRWMLPVRTLAG